MSDGKEKTGQGKKGGEGKPLSPRIQEILETSDSALQRALAGYLQALKEKAGGEEQEKAWLAITALCGALELPDEWQLHTELKRLVALTIVSPTPVAQATAAGEAQVVAEPALNATPGNGEEGKALSPKVRAILETSNPSIQAALAGYRETLQEKAGAAAEQEAWGLIPHLCNMQGLEFPDWVQLQGELKRLAELEAAPSAPGVKTAATEAEIDFTWGAAQGVVKTTIQETKVEIAPVLRKAIEAEEAAYIGQCRIHGQEGANSTVWPRLSALYEQAKTGYLAGLERRNALVAKASSPDPVVAAAGASKPGKLSAPPGNVLRNIEHRRRIYGAVTRNALFDKPIMIFRTHYPFADRARKTNMCETLCNRLQRGGINKTDAKGFVIDLADRLLAARTSLTYR